MVQISNFDKYIPVILIESPGYAESTKSLINITSFSLETLPIGTENRIFLYSNSLIFLDWGSSFSNQKGDYFDIHWLNKLIIVIF